MNKNVVLLSDGTGNAAAKIWRSNAWRFFQYLDLTNAHQVACYDEASAHPPSNRSPFWAAHSAGA